MICVSWTIISVLSCYSERKHTISIHFGLICQPLHLLIVSSALCANFSIIVLHCIRFQPLHCVNLFSHKSLLCPCRPGPYLWRADCFNCGDTSSMKSFATFLTQNCCITERLFFVRRSLYVSVEQCWDLLKDSSPVC